MLDRLGRNISYANLTISVVYSLGNKPAATIKGNLYLASSPPVQPSRVMSHFDILVCMELGLTILYGKAISSLRMVWKADGILTHFRITTANQSRCRFSCVNFLNELQTAEELICVSIYPHNPTRIQHCIRTPGSQIHLVYLVNNQASTLLTYSAASSSSACWVHRST